MQAVTTIVEHSAKSGVSQKGQWTRHTFKGSDGTKYQTFDAGLANTLYGLSFTNQAPNGAQVTITFEPTQNGQYTNNDITAVAGGAVAVPGVPSPAPTSAAPTSTGPSSDQRAKEIRIMRQHAMTDAIGQMAVLAQLGVITTASYDDFVELAERNLRQYAGGPQTASAGNGSAQSAAGTPSPAAGGGLGGEQAATPAPAQQVSADDDIPF